MVLHTVLVAAGATALALPLGTALAFLTERSTVPARSMLRFGVLLPLVVPAFVLGFSWGQAYGPGGLTDDLFGLTMPGLFGPVGIIVVQAIDTAPLAYLIVVAGWRPAPSRTSSGPRGRPGPLGSRRFEP